MIIIYQISEESNNKRLAHGEDSLIYKEYHKPEFSMKNYQVAHIVFKSFRIKKQFYDSVLNQIENNFKSFYTFDGRKEKEIVVSDLVKIGTDLYYYNGKNSWKYLGKQPVRKDF